MTHVTLSLKRREAAFGFRIFLYRPTPLPGVLCYALSASTDKRWKKKRRKKIIIIMFDYESKETKLNEPKWQKSKFSPSYKL